MQLLKMLCPLLLLTFVLPSLVIPSATHNVDLSPDSYCREGPNKLSIIEAKKHVPHFCDEFDITTARKRMYLGAGKTKLTLNFVPKDPPQLCVCSDEVQFLFGFCKYDGISGSRDLIIYVQQVIMMTRPLSTEVVASGLAAVGLRTMLLHWRIREFCAFAKGVASLGRQKCHSSPEQIYIHREQNHLASTSSLGMC